MKTMMSHSIVRALHFAGLSLALCFLPGCKVAKGTGVSEAKVTEFHARWNAEEWKTIYDDSHVNLRTSESEAKLVGVLSGLKKTYGTVQSTSKESTGFSSDNGITDIKLSYRTVYEHGEGVEKFVFRMSGEDAKLMSYELMPPEEAAARAKAAEEAREAEQAAKEAAREAERAARDAEREAKKAAREAERAGKAAGSGN